MSAHVWSDTGQVTCESELRPGVPPAKPPLGELQLPGAQRPQRALGPDDLRVRQQREGEVGQLGEISCTDGEKAEQCVQQDDDSET